MSTIQKAFIFIVLILAVLTATAQLVLFAQRSDWQQKYEDAAEESRRLQSELSSVRQDLQETERNASAKVSDLEAQLADKNSALIDTQAKLESLRMDKADLEALVSQANSKLDIVAKNVESLASRNEALSESKEQAEKELSEARAALQDAQEQLTIVSRQKKDLQAKVESLEQQLDEREQRVAQLEQKVNVLEQYAPAGVGPEVTGAPEAEVYGRITGISDDGSTAYLSVGSDDNVEDGMVLIVYKPADGTFAGRVKVYSVSADKSAARILRPVYASITEGDNVATQQ